MEIVNPLRYNNWNDLVTAAGGAYYHTSNWARVLSESYGYEPLYFIIVEGGRLSLLIPLMDVRSFLTGRRGVSLPFTDYCDLIVLNDDYKAVAIDCMKEYGKRSGWKYIEFRDTNNFFGGETCYKYYCGHILSLSGNEDELLSGMRESTWRNVRKARSLGVKTEISTSLASIEEFYRLHCMTRKRHGLPPQPYLFFKKVHEHIILKNLGIVVLATHRGKFVAGGVFFQFGDRAFYKYGASDLNYQELRSNNLIMWEAISHYAVRGYKTFCMGRAEQGATGLRQFKNGWGTKENIIRYFRYDPARGGFSGDCSPMREHNYGIFHLLPLPMLKNIGNLLYRHIG